MKVPDEGGARLDGDDGAAVLPDAVEQLAEQLATLGGVVLDLPEAAEVVEQRFGPGDVGVCWRSDALDLLLQRLAAHDVLVLAEVAHDVEVLEAVELGEQVAAALRLRALIAGRGLEGVDDVRAQLAVRVEAPQPLDDLLLQRLGLHDRLRAVAAATAGAAAIAAALGARPARALHAGAAALAVEELAQQVLLGRPAAFDDAGAPATDLLHAVEQLLGHDRLVPAADLARRVAQAADVAAVGGVEEHLAHRVRAEASAAGGLHALGVEPLGDGAVRLLAGRVALVHREHERCALRVGQDVSGRGVAHVAPGDRADEVSLPCFLGEPGAGPERERNGVVLVEHLVDRLGEERRGVARVVAHRLRDRDDADAEPLAQQSFVAARLDLVAREARGVEDEHDVEAPLGRVGHQALELGAAIGLAPARVEVAVRADDGQVVLGGELGDGLALGVGREALALLLGRLAHVGGRAGRWRGCVRHRRAVAPRRRAGARDGATSPRTNARSRAAAQRRRARAHRGHLPELPLCRGRRGARVCGRAAALGAPCGLWAEPGPFHDRKAPRGASEVQRHHACVPRDTPRARREPSWTPLCRIFPSRWKASISGGFCASA
ncbi:MAG TPA: hypothetical protein VF250_07495 [Conexibacter sp.]